MIRDAAALPAGPEKEKVALFDFVWGMKRELEKKGRSFSREALGEYVWRMVGREWELTPYEKRVRIAQRVQERS